jgi:hypothetical protein
MVSEARSFLRWYLTIDSVMDEGQESVGSGWDPQIRSAFHPCANDRSHATGDAFRQSTRLGYFKPLYSQFPILMARCDM